MKSLLIILLISGSLLGHELREYAIKDVGTLSADWSFVIDLNNKNQILGRLIVGGEQNYYIWSQETGLQLIGVPGQASALSDNGQVTGVIQRAFSDGQIYEVFIWNQIHCAEVVYVSKHNIGCSRLNLNNQMLLYEYDNSNQKHTIYLWDHSKKTLRNISEEFLRKVKDDYPGFSALLTNDGELVVVATEKGGTSKSFYVKGDDFVQMSLGFDITDGVIVKDIDKSGNVIVQVVSRISKTNISSRFYFLNDCESKKIEIRNHSRELFIRNGVPVQDGCTPSILKYNAKGEPYYVPGAEIEKLIKREDNFWCGRLSFLPQNENGLLAGTSETIFPDQQHAVLIYPKVEMEK